MLKAEGKINDFVIENMMNWHHSGFNVYCGEAIWPQNEEGLENLARFVIRASFSQERMTYHRREHLCRTCINPQESGESFALRYLQ